MQFFQAPPATRYDLNFNLFGFPVRIHPLYWLLSLLLASGSRNLLYILVFFVVIFVSLLIHELGHAFALRSMGQESQIVLYHGGGLTIPEETRLGLCHGSCSAIPGTGCAGGRSRCWNRVLHGAHPFSVSTLFWRLNRHFLSTRFYSHPAISHPPG